MASLSLKAPISFFFWGWSIMSGPGVPHPGDPWKVVGISRKEIVSAGFLFSDPGRVPVFLLDAPNPTHS
ncbi:hypothetical protein OPV22_033143 [Ensete ventricosum]|uniref:Uncharacterized protein n=1 Tax=Ensete ventricosum TaxID=4639 RepID=A0AAV8PP87_ENSVE|nr:hypothetical protein OPV22_033143 [Ensete ventricosum]